MKRLIYIFITLILSCSNSTHLFEINTATSVDVDGLNPFTMVSSRTEEILRNVYEGLVKPDIDGKIQPAIAKDYRIINNGKKYIFVIRDNVYFHNGNKLKMSDIVFSIKKAKELNIEDEFSNIRDVYYNKNILTIDLYKPDYSLIYYLIVPIIEEKSYSTISKIPNGLGPYILDSYRTEQYIKLKRFDNYYGKKANIQRVNIRIIPNEETQMLKFLSNEMNLLLNINRKRIKELKEKKVEKNLSNTLLVMGINNNLYDKKMRLALNSAINRDEIINIALNGYGEKIGKETDVNLELLKGKVFEMKISTHNPLYKETAQIIKQQLAKYGAKVNIVPIEWSTWLDTVYKKREFELTLIALTGEMDKYVNYRRYKSDYMRNFNSFYNEEYDIILSQAKATKNRDEIFKKLDSILYDDIPNVFILRPYNMVAMDNDIYGYLFYDTANINFSSMYFGRD